MSTMVLCIIKFGHNYNKVQYHLNPCYLPTPTVKQNQWNSIEEDLQCLLNDLLQYTYTLLPFELRPEYYA